MAAQLRLFFFHSFSKSNGTEEILERQVLLKKSSEVANVEPRNSLSGSNRANH